MTTINAQRRAAARKAARTRKKNMKKAMARAKKIGRGVKRFHKKAKAKRKATAKKAWRFEGEMIEIAKTFLDANLPGGFHEAAAEIYERMSDLKDSDEEVNVESVTKRILN